MHPLELTDFLNGFGENLSLVYEDWSNMIPEYISFLEWMVANKQNRFSQ